MHNVVVLATELSVASTFIGPMDVFQQTGRLYNRIARLPENPAFAVRLATATGEPFKTRSGVVIQPHCGIGEIHQTDVLVIAALGNIHRALANHRATIDWVRDLHSRGALIATVCTGAFLLASTGLLDGKSATTHWGFADLFAKMFPEVALKPDRLITDEGSLVCSGGFNAGIDLAIYLINKICGRALAVQCAKSIIHDMGRRLQAPYRAVDMEREHGDRPIRQVQDWIEAHYREGMNSAALARQCGMSRRTFERRFKQATGRAPRQYIQQVRIEAARQMLEQTRRNIDDIAFRVGYADTSAFRKVFIKYTGLAPKIYQSLYQSGIALP